jgi:hypothetical protein
LLEKKKNMVLKACATPREGAARRPAIVGRAGMAPGSASPPCACS